MKKILVTGGAGYIGSHTCVELLNEGHEIAVIDNFSNSKMEALKRVKKITGKEFPVYDEDVCDRDALDMIFRENDFDAVIHFAGLKAVGESVQIPLEYYQNNIGSTLTLCSVMQDYNVKKLVFSSSATVYGNPEKVPITEDAPLWCTNPYGWTKFMNEQILKDQFGSDPSWSIILLRYFNPIGAHESGLIGEDPNGIPNNLLPFISQVAIGRRNILQVFGNDYETIDGTGVRDYIHVVDLAKGHCKAIDRTDGFIGVDPVNLGTGTGYSVLQIIAAFEKESGRKIPYETVDRRPGDIAVCYADPEKARKVLLWRAEMGIDQMCRDAWRWQSMNPDGYPD
ncbi:MAG: UDP-glucose 4-epimerase GalE [Saccharofermentanales bacterium]